MGVRRIGELLVSEGLLTESAVSRALGFQRLSGERIKIGSILLDWDLLAEEALLATLGKHHRCPAIDWPTLSAAPMEVVRLLPAASATRFGAIPFALDRATLRVAFVDPGNLAVIDEISAITGKRVAPCVTSEVRLMQAHQKFYGRHLPGGFRAIVQKLERKTAQTRRGAEPKPTVDFRAPDLVAASATKVPVLPGPDFESLSPPELPSLEGSAAAGPAHADWPTAAPPPAPSEPAPEIAPPIVAPPVSPRDDSIRSGDDSLVEWVGDALASFQQEGTPAGTAPGSIPAASGHCAAVSLPAPAPRSPSSDEVASGMWRASSHEDGDAIASGMWSPGEDAESPLWEARTREEIGDAVLQNALTHLPRVLLFGSGKTAVTGWRGRAPALSPGDVEAVRIPASARTVFAAVLASGVPHFGPVERSEWPAALHELLGKDPPDCAIFPIRVLDGVAAFLYADRDGRPMLYTDFALIARAAASTANVLARFLLRSNTAPVA